MKFTMIIISKSIIYVFAEKHPDVRVAVDDWYRKVKLANWSNFGEMKNAFNTVDYVGNDRFVFNLKGNRYRIVVMIHLNVELYTFVFWALIKNMIKLIA